MQNWFYIGIKDGNPFDYHYHEEVLKIDVQLSKNLFKPGGVIVYSEVDEKKGFTLPEPVVKLPFHKLKYDSKSVYFDEYKNAYMSKIYGFASYVHDYLKVIPPVIINPSYSQAFLYIDTAFPLLLPNINDIFIIIEYLKLFPSIDKQTLQSNLDEAIKQQSNIFLIAQGRAMKSSYRPYVISKIDIKKNVGKVHEDGTIDYKERESIKEVFQGDIIGDYFKGSEGAEGFNVYGQTMAIVEEYKGPAPGKNMYIDPENPNIMRSSVNGYLSIKNQTIEVVETLLIGGDIDYETGNIEFSGNMEIKGKVTSGFTVTCLGSLYIHGIVEAANIFAKNGLTIKSGVISREGFKIETHGDMNVKFIQNGSIIVKGDLKVDQYIYNSKVMCNSSVFVNGTISGGSVISKLLIKSLHAGNKSGVKTELICGVDQEFDEKVSNKRKNILSLIDKRDYVMNKIKNQFPSNFLKNPVTTMATLSPEERSAAALVLEQLKKINDWLDKAQKELLLLESGGLKNDYKPAIIITGTEFNGVLRKIVTVQKS